jgi:hypothetical protein
MFDIEALKQNIIIKAPNNNKPMMRITSWDNPKSGVYYKELGINVLFEDWCALEIERYKNIKPKRCAEIRKHGKNIALFVEKVK